MYVRNTVDLLTLWTCKDDMSTYYVCEEQSEPSTEVVGSCGPFKSALLPHVLQDIAARNAYNILSPAVCFSIAQFQRLSFICRKNNIYLLKKKDRQNV